MPDQPQTTSRLERDKIMFSEGVAFERRRYAQDVHGELDLARAALRKAQAALNPLSGFLRRRTPKMERYLESVREEIRKALHDA